MDFKDNLPGNTTDLDRIHPIDLEHEMKKSFISYAMAVIITRALPDVRDGLKPVHRRILYAMHELGVTPDKPYRKCARIVGDVLGKYHPHGDSSVYGALVRLAQDFATRYPLVEGQGNFGSVDGDGAAAMRYTEARMSKINMEMLADIDKETVDFSPNFDETLMQPNVLPSRFPNLLVNGSSGIAVGMATNIPPHNLGEVIDGVVKLIDKPDATNQELMECIKGPDFPTGGIILGRKGIYDTYTTGRGRIIVRAKTDIEPMGNNRQRIIVTEIPYMVNKSVLVAKIAELVHEKRLEGISDIRDESDREGMRIVIELKKDVNAAVVLNYLYKHTQMQDVFGAIMLALVDGEPKVLSLHQMLFHYLEHQKDVITRRTRYDLDKAEARAHILEGLLIALDNIDEIVRIIRGSANTAEAKVQLMERFGLSDKQAQAILDMRLARLTGLERERLQEEYAELEKTIAYLRAVLADEKMVLAIVREEILAIKEKYADPRRTEIGVMDGEIDPEDLIQEDSVVVTLSHFGYVKRTPRATYRSQNRGGKGIIGMTTREEDYAEKLIVSSTHDDLMFFTNKGRVYSLKGYEIPEGGRTARGTAIVNLLQLDGGEKVTAMIKLPREREGRYLVMATRCGTIKKTALDEFANLRKAGLIAIVLREEDELIGVELTDASSEIMLATRMGQAIRFSEDDVRAMGRNSMGVRSMDLAEGDEVISVAKITEGTQVLAITQKGYGKRTEISEFRSQSRGGKGILAMRLTEKTGLMAAQLLVREDEDLMLITDDGTIIRMPVGDISVIGRVSQGVRVMRVEGDSRIVGVTVTEREAEKPEDEAQDAEKPDNVPTESDDLSMDLGGENEAPEGEDE
ncbi:MAG: DNA gyrase subunit A [Clostridiales bacterium]|nr:DNA gyrase subunit A [Clostridiales bacterium]MDY5513750.1 DNA gyrase subunit A [Candidatus Ventricola sp.]